MSPLLVALKEAKGVVLLPGGENIAARASDALLEETRTGLAHTEGCMVLRCGECEGVPEEQDMIDPTAPGEGNSQRRSLQVEQVLRQCDDLEKE